MHLIVGEDAAALAAAVTTALEESRGPPRCRPPDARRSNEASGAGPLALAARARRRDSRGMPRERVGTVHNTLRIADRAVGRVVPPRARSGRSLSRRAEARVFPDSKTFVDARPLGRAARHRRRVRGGARGAGVRLRAFVERTSRCRGPPARGRRDSDTRQTWSSTSRALARAHAPADAPDPHSSLIPLPEPYVVPGGRFREVYYWDSYFTMLGLIESGRADLVQRHARQLRASRAHRGPHPERESHLLPEPEPAALLRARWSGSTRRPPTRRRRSATSTRSRRARVLDGGRRQARARATRTGASCG